MGKNNLSIATILAYFLMIFINWYAESLPINGVTMAEVSASVSTLFTPPGYVFSIWLIIYLLLFIFVIYQFLPSQRCKSYYRQIRLPFIITCLLNSIWVILFHHFLFTWNLLTIIGLMIYLSIIYVVLNKHKCNFNGKEELFVYFPFSIYFAWTTIAVIANVSIVLVANGWGGWGISPVIWTMIVILLGLGLIIYIANKFRDPYVLLVYLWAYLGLVYKYLYTSYKGPLIVTLFACMVLMINLIYIVQKE
ncbi:tryptophan-rich sensory protein [Vallitalea okinawensis]|uniref:tryptophan-rich sensory protein n=1 Tax=Vallitalea okinawensis TaxID=2078660 RepID=UPI000CFB340C|nr:tryptophan-rich sensory protein [Vallitalea okinawensis]